MKKRVIAWLLMLCMLLTAVPAMAAEEVYDCAKDGHVMVVIRTLREGSCKVAGIYEENCAVCGKALNYVSRYAHVWEDVVLDATCTEPAKAGQVCALCGAKSLTDVVGTVALGHDMSKTPNTAHKDYVAATCDKGGVDVFTCSRCDYVRKSTSPAKGHKLLAGTEEVVKATCTKPESLKFLCANCGEYVTEEVGTEVLGHNYQLLDETEATCKEGGLKMFVCSRCGEVKTEVTLPDSSKHVEVETVVRPATCTSNGIGKYTCAVCNNLNEYRVIKATHSMPVEIRREPANCGKEGKIYYECADCGAKFTETLKKVGTHNYVEGGLADADCTHNAKVGTVCSVCGQVKPGTTPTEIPGTALDHDWKLDTTNKDYKPATCTEKGKDTFKCSRCGQSKVEETDALEHKFDEGVHADATCTTVAGVKYTCKVCGAVEIDAYDKTAVADGHKYVAGTPVAPTCKDAGYTLMTCSVCGDSYKINVTAPSADAHKMELVSVLKEADCTVKPMVNGIGKYNCSVCGKNPEYKVINAADHAFVVSEKVAATCGTDGYTKYICARGCGATKTTTIPATGKHKYVDAYYPETCTEAAMTGEKCSVCGYVNPEKVEYVVGSVALGHDLVENKEHKDYVAATCTAPGMIVKTCTRCDYVEKTIDPQKKHSWDAGVYTPATCENPEGVLKTCAVCGKTEVTPLEGGDPALNHDDKVEVVKPNCKNQGYTIRTCKVCGDVRKDTYTPINKDAHVEKMVSELKPATCTSNGVGKYVCQECNEDLGYRIIKGGHKTEEVITKEATCVTKGEKLVICTVCGEEKTEVIPATGKHTLVPGKKVDATCDKPAMVADVCSVCGYETNMKPVPGSKPLNHKLANGDTAMVLNKDDKRYEPAKCDKPGVDVKTCSLCGYTTVTASEALKHNYVVTGYVDATCDFGSGVQSVCTLCGDVKVVEDNKHPATGHKWVDDQVDATCVKEGYKFKTCAVCGKVEKGAVIPTSQGKHDYEETIVKAATCTTTGIKRLQCKLCGVSTYATIDAGHKWGEDIIGHDVIYKECSVCGKTEVVFGNKDGIINPAHVWVEVNGKAATCTEAGREPDLVCKICNEIKSVGKEIPATGHKMAEIEGTAKEATCTEAGKAADTKCSVCGFEVKGAEIPALGHKWVSAENGVPATCTEAGKEADKKCSVCEAVEASKEIPALGHDIVADAAVAATCTEAGKTAGEHCTRCDYAVAQEVIPATGHDIVVDAAVAATCTSEGKTAGEHCTKCDHKVAQETIPMKAHSYKTVYSLSEDGTMRIITKTCTVCGHEEVKQEAI